MNSRYLINVVLILALCVSQIAASVHIVGHLHAAENHGEHAGAHIHDHTHDHTHTHQHPDSDSLSSNTLKSDCSVYHAFAGMAGIAPSDSSKVVIKSKRTSAINQPEVIFVGKSVDAQPIRGPPTYS